MTINFPSSLDNFTNPTSSSPINSPSHADQHANANDAIEALEAKVGVDGSTVVTSHDYKIAQLQSLVTSAVAGAKSIYQDVRNQSGSAFTKATPVYVSGSTGASGQLLVSAASNATEATSSKTMGITTSAISNNSNGQVISEGILEGIDTTGAADGDPVWLGVNGAKIYGLANKPSAPAHLVFLGVVIRGGQANTGSMYVKIQNGFELQEIHNVEISSLVNGNILAYDSTIQTWKNTNTIQSTSSTTPLVVKGTSSPSVNIFEVQNSGGYPMVFVDAYGALKAQASGMYVNSGYASGTGLVVRGYTSQTADLQQWQNSAGTVLSSITASGDLNFNSTLWNIKTSGTNVIQWQPSTGSTFLSYGSSNIPITVQGSSGQTGNLQQWKNSAGTVLAFIRSDGFIRADAKIQTPTIYGSSATSGTQVNIANSWTFLTNLSTNVGIIVQGAASQTANLQEWQNSSGTVLASIDANGQASFKSTTLTASSSGGSSLTLVAASGQTAPLLITSGGAQIPAGGNYFRAPGIEATYVMNVTSGNLGTIPFIVKGAASQTADLQQWQDSAGTVLAYVAANGHLLTPRLNITNGGNIVDSAGTTPYFGFGSNQISIYARNAAYKPLVIQGASSQTANLQEWQDSSGNVLSKIDSFGAFKTASTASFGTISGGGVWGGYSPVVEIRNTGASTSAINIFANGGPAIRVYDGSGYQRGAWNQDGSIVVGQSNTKLATLSVYADSATSVGTIIRGAASQTANLQEWQNSAGTAIATMSPGGNLDIALRLTAYNGVSAYNASTFGDPGILLPYTYSNVVGISTGYFSNVGLVIKGVTSQSGDLQQWRDSSGNILTGISSNGLIYSGKSYSSYNIESAGTLASSESIANTFNLQGKNNLIYPSIITDVGGNGWTSVTPNYGTAPDGTQTSTRYVWNSQGNCYGTASDSNPNTYAGDIYTVSAYIKINSGTGSFDLRYSKADSSKNAGIRINLSTKTATAAFDASDYNVLSYSLVPVGKNWYRAIATIKVLVNHTIERVIFAATGNVGDIEVWGFQLEKGLSASPLTSTTNSVITTINTLNIPYGQINLQSNASTIGLIIKSANSQTASLTEWQTNTGATVASIDSNGSAFLNSNFQVNGVAAIGGGPQAYSQLIIQTNSATRNGLVIKAASSQTANIQEWQNNSGTVLANIDSTGRFLSTRPIRTDDVITSGSQTVTLGQISAISSGAGRVGLVVRGAVSQAVNLQEWQNNAGTILLSITPDGSLKGGNSNTISVNTASTVDTVALSSFTSMEYTLSIKQGSKIRSSKVLVHTDGTSVDSTEYGIMEMGGGITGILVTASVSGTDAILQVTITDAATTNATVKLIKTML